MKNAATISLDNLIAQVRAGDYDRFLCIQLAPAKKRAGLYAITAFAIEIARVAEIVSEALIGHIRLAWWREALEEIIAGKTPRNHPTVIALAEIYRQVPSLFNELLLMVEARAADLDSSLMDEEQAWLHYCDHTAGALHMAWAKWLDADASAKHEKTIRDAARAYALLGLVRAIPFMHSHGLMRFPSARMEAHQIASLAQSPGVTRLSQEIVTMALTLTPRVQLPRVLAPLAGIECITQTYAHWLQKVNGDPYHLRRKKLTLVWKMVVLNIQHHLCF